MSKCRCKSSSGAKKTRYGSRQGAVTVALRRGWLPNTYPCPHGSGFHLTERKARK